LRLRQGHGLCQVHDPEAGVVHQGVDSAALQHHFAHALSSEKSSVTSSSTVCSERDSRLAVSAISRATAALRSFTSRIVANTRNFLRASVSAISRPKPLLVPVMRTT